MINAIIVDDEPLALDVLETYINRLDDINLVAKCNNAIEALDVLKKEDVDIMFLDIQMPQLTGIDLVKALSDPPLVIFTTAYPNYALEGFDLNVADYLLKPISFERFVKSVNKVSTQLNLQRGTQLEASEKDESDFIFVKSDKKLIKIKYGDILYIEGLKDYVIIRMNTGRVITLQTMKSLEVKLPTNIFKRIHRSYIVNLSCINAVVGNMIELTEKNQTKHLPIGKNYRDKLLDIINQNRL